MATGPIVIFLEGTISAGKSSFLDNIKRWSRHSDKFHIIPEPIDEWMSVGKAETGESIFEKYYGNPEKYAFPFQFTVFQSYVRNLLAAIEQHRDVPILIVERSVWSIRNVFIESMLRRGILEEIHRVIFDTWMPFIINDVYRGLGNLNRFIYLYSDIDLCIDRIRERGRIGEDAIGIDLMRSLHECHEDWLRPSDQLDIITLDHMINFKTDEQRYRTEIIDRFDQYLERYIVN